jgi:hypothetical protein
MYTVHHFICEDRSAINPRFVVSTIRLLRPLCFTGKGILAFGPLSIHVNCTC